MLDDMKNKPLWTRMSLLLIALVLVSAGLGNAAVAVDPLVIVYSGNTSGFTEPSG